MNDEERDGPGPIGLNALNEMGRRLLDVLGSVERRFTQDQSSRTADFTIKTPRGRVAGTVGFSIRHGLVSQQPDEPLPPRRDPPVPQPKIDGPEGQLIDVFDEPTEVLVTVAPCAAGPHELVVRVEGAELHIEATGGRRFRKRIRLPRDLGDAVPVVSLSNGILGIRIPKPASIA
ncbi:MAG: Hsp20/alpha crystallin family protein [Bradyrhizobium sp.]